MVNLKGFVKVKGFDDYYINKEGVIYSFKRTKPIKLTPKDNGYGYLRVILARERKSISRYIHRLLAENFIPNPENHKVVRHLNDIKTDNRLENLAWGSYKDNALDCIKNGYVPKSRSLTDEQVKFAYHHPENSTKTAKILGVKRNIVKSIRGRHSYKNVTKDLGEPYRVTLSYDDLTFEDVQYIKTSSDSNRSLGRKYNISHGIIKKIKKGYLDAKFTNNN